jgi:hypothetical protein
MNVSMLNRPTKTPSARPFWFVSRSPWYHDSPNGAFGTWITNRSKSVFFGSPWARILITSTGPCEVTVTRAPACGMQPADNDRIERRVVDTDVEKRSNPCSLDVIRTRQLSRGARSIDHLHPGVGRDPPIVRRPQPSVNRTGMITQSLHRGGRKDHRRAPRDLTDHLPSELGQDPPKLQLPECSGGAIGHRDGERQRVQAPTETALDVVEVAQLGAELVDDRHECLPIEERDVGTRGKCCRNLRTWSPRLRRDRPDAMGRCRSYPPCGSPAIACQRRHRLSRQCCSKERFGLVA